MAMPAKNEDEVVRKAPLFSALDDASAASLRASMNGIKISKGQVLFKEGDPGGQVKTWHILRGRQRKPLINFRTRRYVW
jgi:hypothetical protein